MFYISAEDTGSYVENLQVLSYVHFLTRIKSRFGKITEVLR